MALCLTGRLKLDLSPLVNYEKHGLANDALDAPAEIDRQGVAEVIVVNRAEHLLEGGSLRRAPDGAAAGQ